MKHSDVATDRPQVDLLDPALYQRNPHDIWTWMRANEPVYRDERNGLWGLSRHADVMDVERRECRGLSLVALKRLSRAKTV